MDFTYSELCNAQCYFGIKRNQIVKSKQDGLVEPNPIFPSDFSKIYLIMKIKAVLKNIAIFFKERKKICF